MKRFNQLALAVMAVGLAGMSVPAAAASVSGLVNQTLAQVSGDAVIPNQYIVTLNKPAAGDLLAGLPVADQAAALVASVGGGQILHSYEYALRGFAVRINALQADLLRANPLVARVSEDLKVVAYATQNSPASYGLDRIDQRNLPLNSQYNYPDLAGQGAHIYVIDTGLNPNHSEFSGRVGTSRNFISGEAATNWTDCNGHGTHVMGTAGGTSYGVAKKATLHALRVLDCGGSGSSADIIAAMNWLIANQETPAVANMSLGTQYIPFVNTRSAEQEAAVKNMVNANIAVALAAGNDSADACKISPAAAPEALTVGATQSNDAKASYSNYGTCLDLFAPGSAIISADYANNSGSTSMDGTSMASPHVAGALALKRASNPGLTAAQAQSALVSDTTTGKVTSPGTGSPNKLLYVVNSGGGTPVDTAPVANFSASCSNLSCTFTSTSTDDKGIAATSWNFGDSSSGSGSPVSKTYAAPGTYSVTLTVTDTIGQTNVKTQPVTVTAASSGPCSDCTKVSGTLASGGTAYSPSSTGAARNAGQFKGYLRGPAGTDFDLFLEKASTGILGGTTWSIVARGETTSSSEDIVYSGTAGTYRWRIKSYSGAGTYDFYFKNP